MLQRVDFKKSSYMDVTIPDFLPFVGRARCLGRPTSRQVHQEATSGGSPIHGQPAAFGQDDPGVGVSSPGREHHGLEVHSSGEQGGVIKRRQFTLCQ